MDRPIKFKVHDYKTKKLISREHAGPNGWVVYICDELLTKKRRRIWRQYTGFNDKNGVEIYEGDIIYSSHIEDQKAGPIKWSNIHHGYIIEYPRRTGDGMDQWQQAHGKEHCYEVVGNIYENPEVMKNETDKHTNSRSKGSGPDPSEDKPF